VLSPLPIDLLGDDWSRELARPDLARHLQRWRAAEPALAPFEHPSALLRYMRRTRGGEREDALLRALVRRARHDPLAARLVLQRLLPGFKRRAGRILLDAGEREELWSLLLACAWERIRAYPVERLPRRVAANLIVTSVRHALERLERERTRALRMAGPPSVEIAERDLGETNIDLLLAGAVKAGAISAEEAELIAQTRIDRVPLAVVAVGKKAPYDALRLKRRRAERRLLLHLGMRDVRFGGSKPPLCSARVAGAGPTTGLAGARKASETPRR
jgi:hypothetical protein